ncbi:hypothetical protein MLD38_016825 [Melastoma candidum]|uniref:Uncharacterized protein n=1 Tax=Melastoma candidum TaxID=119954 RepID=A0ACB9QNK1_9MYRT|nr:hypothetical protein MLD38_016825 [Melastoma candidum]
MLSTRGNASMPFPEKKKKRFGIRSKSCAKELINDKISAESFTFRELACATNNFRPDNLLGEGGFSRVYKGTLHKSGEVVAIKQMDKNGITGNKEFLLEVTTLSRLSHKNLVDFIGYCFNGDQRLLVFRYLSGGTLANRMFGIRPEDQEPLDWITRMKIAYGAAKGLEYLHDGTRPPIIHGYLKSSSILLDEDLNPKLSDFGVAEFRDGQEKMQVSARVMKTYGYCAPEYTSTGQLTLKSDVYSFGVVLLELITGRKVIDTARPNDEQNLVNWANPRFRDPKQFPEMVDPLLEGKFPEKDLNQAVAIAAMCLQYEASARPLMSDIVTALSFLSGASVEFLRIKKSGEEEIRRSGRRRRDAEREMIGDKDVNKSRERCIKGANHQSLGSCRDRLSGGGSRTELKRLHWKGTFSSCLWFVFHFRHEECI